MIKSLIKKYCLPLARSASEAAPNPGGTEYEVNNWIISEFVLKRLVPVVGAHPYPLNELMLMAGAVCRFRPTHIFEWGTNIGASARVFFETGRHFRIPLEIHSVDLPPEVDHVEQPGRQRGALVRGKPGVTLHLGDGIETSLSICKTMPANGRALFFVDGDHGYESVRRELAMILESVKNPAVLLHDTFYQSKDSGYNIGPFEAVRDVLAGHTAPEKFRVIALNTGLPGMTLIYPAQG
jgi:hypothetical protein